MWVTVGWVGIEVQIAFFIGGAYEMMPLKSVWVVLPNSRAVVERFQTQNRDYLDN